MKKNTILTWGLLLSFLTLLPLIVNAQPIRNKLREMFVNRVRKRNQSFNVKSELNYLNHDNRMRSYYIYKPTTWNRKDEIPLVFLFHGGGGNARSSLYFYKLEETAEKHGFLLVAPNGTGGNDVLLTWNVLFGFAYAFDNNVDDLDFIRTLKDKLKAKYPIDPDRIYATGLSNGAILCHFLAAQPHNRFAAIAPVVGTHGGQCLKTKKIITPVQPKTFVSVCIISGLKDKSVPVDGGLQKKSVDDPRIMLSVSDTLNFWAKANDCDPHYNSYYDEKLDSNVYTYKNTNASVTVKAYVIRNHGHAWPGSPEPTHRGADVPAKQFPANEIIWEFFKQHPRASE